MSNTRVHDHEEYDMYSLVKSDFKRHDSEDSVSKQINTSTVLYSEDAGKSSKCLKSIVHALSF